MAILRTQSSQLPQPLARFRSIPNFMACHQNCDGRYRQCYPRHLDGSNKVDDVIRRLNLTADCLEAAAACIQPCEQAANAELARKQLDKVAKVWDELSAGGNPEPVTDALTQKALGAVQDLVTDLVRSVPLKAGLKGASKALSNPMVEVGQQLLDPQAYKDIEATARAIRNERTHGTRNENAARQMHDVMRVLEEQSR